jgi:hypothetical protein
VIGQEVESAELSDVFEARRIAGRHTIGQVESSALVPRTPSSEGPDLTPSAARLVTSVGNVTTGSMAMHAVLRRLGLRVHLLPALLTRARAAELRAARRGHDRFSDPVIGWDAGSEGAPVPEYATAVAEGVLEVLDARPRVRVELVGDRSRLPMQLLGHPRVVVLSGRPRPEALARWAVHLWTPSLFDGDIADDTRSIHEVGAVGVATVLPEPAQSSIGGYPPPGLLVAGFRETEDWIVPLCSLLDSEATRSRLSRAAMRRFDTMLGAAASAVVVNRFIGWALYQETSR